MNRHLPLLLLLFIGSVTKAADTPRPLRHEYLEVGNLLEEVFHRADSRLHNLSLVISTLTVQLDQGQQPRITIKGPADTEKNTVNSDEFNLLHNTISNPFFVNAQVQDLISNYLDPKCKSLLFRCAVVCVLSSQKNDHPINLIINHKVPVGADLPDDFFTKNNQQIFEIFKRVVP